MEETNMKHWIRNASYQQLLSKWRFDPLDSKWFGGEMGIYFKQKMEEKKAELSPQELVEISKKLGWEHG